MKKKKHIIGKILLGMLILSALGRAGGYNENAGKTDNANIRHGSETVRTAEDEKEEEDITLSTRPDDGENEELEEGRTEIRTELREYLEAYENFIDEYCEFMRNYDSSDTAQLMRYALLVSRMYEFEEKAEIRDDTDMNDEEFLYYTEVMFRTSQKMLAVGLELQ